jgi:hypothetical protein
MQASSGDRQFVKVLADVMRNDVQFSGSYRRYSCTQCKNAGDKLSLTHLLRCCLQDDHSNLTPHNFQAAAEFRPMIDQLYHDLCKR